MTIRLAQNNDKLNIRKLWKLGFGDSDEFLDFYFSDYYDPQSALITTKAGEITASLQTVPSTLIYGGNELPAAYIVGVVTHPEHRMRGYAGELIKAIIADLNHSGVLVSALIPGEPHLFSIYQKYGFANVFSICEKDITPNDLQSADSRGKLHTKRYGREDLQPGRIETEALYEFYTEAYKRAGFCLLKSKETFLLYIREFLSFQGEICVIFKGDDLAACAFLVNRGELSFVKEFLCANESCGNFLLEEIMNTIGQDKITIRTVPSDNNFKSFGMARALNVQGLLRVLTKGKKMSFTIKVADPIILENNGIFTVNNNIVNIDTKTIQPDLNLTITEFTELAFKYGFDIEAFETKEVKSRGYINLMLNS
ncbi:MAG: GNAT family N-acetyltransferase [Chitinispirillales bacterium]|jgi:predicted acetyltransferase|nr:GNAT family N-acetyltransferase [Chitinispirillales bacterium]